MKSVSFKALQNLDQNMLIRIANILLAPYKVDIIYNGPDTTGTAVKVDCHLGARIGVASGKDNAAVKEAMCEAFKLFGIVQEVYLKSGKDFIPDHEIVTEGENSLSGYQHSMLQQWKTYLGITDDFQLNSYIGQWGAKVRGNPGMTIQDLNRDLFNSFLAWLRQNYGEKKK